MNESSLYRKYRPQKFDELLGQDHIVQTLTGVLAADQRPQAYLFAGDRGTGKTTAARIFARELGCSPEDIYEIDAASHRQVADVEEIRESVRTLPMSSQHKVYILDEVHMLSKHAFNALLKTIEEPPRHVIFMMATTEKHKVPDTILSRCQVLEFKNPSTTMLQDMVEKIAKTEKRSIEPNAAELVAMLGRGSFRDTLSILQKVLISISDAKISRESVEAITNTPPLALVHDIVAGIAGGELQAALDALKIAEKHNYDAEMVSEMLLGRLRYVLMLRFDKKASDWLSEDIGDEELKKLQGFVDSKTITSDTLKRMLEAHFAIKQSFAKYIPLELGVIDILGE